MVGSNPSGNSSSRKVSISQPRASENLRNDRTKTPGMGSENKLSLTKRENTLIAAQVFDQTENVQPRPDLSLVQRVKPINIVASDFDSDS